MISFLSEVKSGTTYVVSHNCAKTLTHIFMIHIKSIFDKNQNHHCYNKFLEKGLY